MCSSILYDYCKCQLSQMKWSIHGQCCRLFITEKKILILNEFMQTLMSEQERSDNIKLPLFFTNVELLSLLESDLSDADKAM